MNQLWDTVLWCWVSSELFIPVTRTYFAYYWIGSWTAKMGSIIFESVCRYYISGSAQNDPSDAFKRPNYSYLNISASLFPITTNDIKWISDKLNNTNWKEMGFKLRILVKLCSLTGRTPRTKSRISLSQDPICPNETYILGTLFLFFSLLLMSVKSLGYPASSSHPISWVCNIISLISISSYVFFRDF